MNHLRIAARVAAAPSKAELLKFARGTWPVVSKGKVTHLLRNPETQQEEVVPLPAGVEGYVDEHPEGSDRGGYVPCLDSGAASVYYYDGEWG